MASDEPAGKFRQQLRKLLPEKWFGSFGSAMSVFGTLTTAAAIISLIQNRANIELAALPSEYLGYYRSLIRACVGWIPELLGWTAPQWALDVLAVSGAVGGAAMRALKASAYHQARGFTIAILISIPLLLGWLVGPALVVVAYWFSLSTIREARARYDGWDAKLRALRAAHPGRAFPAERQLESDKALIDRYTEFLTIEKLFVFALLLVAIATVVFFVLNGLAK